MSYQVKLEVFEGPLDLLLYLISKAKINIEDIPISYITAQYMDYINKMQALDIDIASEFLVMAATLLHIKSCSLLPKAVQRIENEEPDPGQQLIQRLKEYKRYKEAGNLLLERYLVYSNLYSKLPEEIVNMDEDIRFSNVTKQDIAKTMQELLKRNQVQESPQAAGKIEVEPISLQNRIRQLKALLCRRGKVLFSELLNKKSNRLQVIVTFLALLEMINKGWIGVWQSKPFSDFVIQRRVLKWKSEK